jgi:diguanylate cyclase (GGDEF)-like protein/PAS domain S-box-containing protein
MRRRLLPAFVVIALLLASNVAMHIWTSRQREAGMESLGHAVGRLALIGSLERHVGELSRAVDFLAQRPDEPVDAAAFARDLGEVEMGLGQLDVLGRGAGSGGAAGASAEGRRLVAAWRGALAGPPADRARAIREAAPLAATMVNELLPRLASDENARVAEARARFRDVSRLATRATLVLFVLSVALVIVAAAVASRQVAAAQRGLEQRVDERTHELAAEVEERRLAEEGAERSLALLRATLESTADGIMAVNADGMVMSYNQKFARMWGIPEEVLALGDHATAMAAALRQVKDPEAFAARAQALFQDREAEATDLVELADGRVFERTSQPQRTGGKASGRVFSFRDVTERYRSDAALRDSEERYALAALGANDGLWDWDLKTRRIYFSPRWAAILGLSPDDVRGTQADWFDRVHPDDADGLGLEVAGHLEGHRPHFEHAFRMRHRDGSWRWVLARGMAVRDAARQPYRMAGSLTDVTDRKLAEEQLAYDAFHDALTGLPNRALFMDRLSQVFHRAQRRAEHVFAVLFLDLDRFKVINDALGHVAGDKLLVTLARRLEECLRPGDTVARLGGDEFVILLGDIGEGRDAVVVAERIQEEVARPVPLSGQEVFTSASIGIAFGGRGGAEPEELLRDADTAMYRAKALGKARCEVFDEAMRQRAVAVLQLETSLRRAVERQELRLVYQPIVRLDTGRVAGVEALLRWDHPERGPVPVAEVVAVAEETGLIVPIGNWVLREACRQARVWDGGRWADGGLAISVNLSARQFMQPRLVQQVEEALEQTGLPHHRLRLEITESAIMQDTDSAQEMLRRLRASHVQVHMDDFGTGYSSMSNLRDFRIDGLKIDRSFVSQLGAVSREAEIVRTIVSLAHNLALEVVGEGVETPEQAEGLRVLGCGYAQGYLFSPPVAPDAMPDLLDRVFRWTAEAGAASGSTVPGG